MNTSSKAKLFLMEFILVILMFAVCAVICVSVFAKADHISRLATAKNEGILIAETTIDEIKSLKTLDAKQLESEIEKIKSRVNAKYSGKYEIAIEYKISDGLIEGSCEIKGKTLGEICKLPLAKYAVGV